LVPRPVLSGIPPEPVYVHPDEQIAQLAREQRGELLTERSPDMEWVVPAWLGEKWSLRMFAEVFDGMERVAGAEKREKPNRVLLATVERDSTVVYYVVHDGLVKPRQN
jgi:tRNA-splicing endonuclease subunit Sen15